MATDKELLRLRWKEQFKQALQADSWGQVIEAQEEYQQMAAVIAAKQGVPTITSREKDTMHRIVLCLSARAQALQTMHEIISSADMALLVSVFDVLFTGAEPLAEDFPIPPHKYQSAVPVMADTEGEILCADADEAPASDWQQAQAALRAVRGTVVGIRIDRIGLKDAQVYIDPHMTVIVADSRANILDTSETPVSKERRATHVIFQHQVYLNVSFEDMQEQGAAVFFEFKHYKPKKKKTSTRCWAFMELDELVPDQEIVLEIYHKPTDLTKKRLRLHSEKPLYLHLQATFITG